MTLNYTNPIKTTKDTQMKKYTLLQTVVALTLAGAMAQAASEGIYVGGSLSLAQTNKDIKSMKIKESGTKTHRDIEHNHYDVKVGYQFSHLGRAELYYRKNILDIQGDDLSTKTYGLNVELNVGSFASGALTPYVSVGGGMGKVSSDKSSLNKEKLKELNAGVGVHYQLGEKIDLQLGYAYNKMYFKDDDISDTDQHSFVVGANYKF